MSPVKLDPDRRYANRTTLPGFHGDVILLLTSLLDDAPGFFGSASACDDAAGAFFTSLFSDDPSCFFDDAAALSLSVFKDASIILTSLSDDAVFVFSSLFSSAVLLSLNASSTLDGSSVVETCFDDAICLADDAFCFADDAFCFADDAFFFADDGCVALLALKTPAINDFSTFSLSSVFDCDVVSVTSDLFLTSLDSDIRMTPSPLDKSEDG
jgi:hypothetical protein